MRPIHLSNYPPISGENGSFATFTLRQRFPAILKRIITDNQFEPRVVAKLNDLEENILNGKIGHLPATGPDVKKWRKYTQPHMGKSWFEVPFYFAEAYFYRMILDAVDFFTIGIDPVSKQKQDDIDANREVMLQIADDFEQQAEQKIETILLRLFQLNLWGNKADLSQLQRNKNDSTAAQTIVDDSGSIIEYLKKRVSRIDIVLDNSGLELFTDILLAVWLINLGLAQKVILHTKAFPTFVSDATNRDILDLIKSIEDQNSNELIQQFHAYNTLDQIQVNDNEFWNAPLHFYDMPVQLQEDLKKSDLVIFKGDANYRRIFGDRVIPYDKSVNTLTKYLPFRSLAIRILKSEIMVGLNESQLQELNTSYPKWLIAGNFGIIQQLN